MYNIHIRTGKLEPNRTESNRYHAGIHIYTHTYIHIQKIVDIYIYIHASYTIYKHHVDSDAIMACHVDWDQPLRRCKCHRDGGFQVMRGTPKSSSRHETFLVLKPRCDLEIPRFRTPDHVNHLTVGDMKVGRYPTQWKRFPVEDGVLFFATLEIPRDRSLDDFMENPQKKWMMMDDDW